MPSRMFSRYNVNTEAVKIDFSLYIILCLLSLPHVVLNEFQQKKKTETAYREHHHSTQARVMEKAS